MLKSNSQSLLAEARERVYKGFSFSPPHDLEAGPLYRSTTILTVYSVSPFNHFRSVIMFVKSAREMKHLAGPVHVQDVQHLI